MRARSERGALLGIVMVLLVLILAASGFAFWGLRGETSSTGNDRLSRQLFDCAEQALAFGKQQFGTFQRNAWDSFLNTDVCSLTTALPCGPFPTGATGTPPINYPTASPYQASILVSPNPQAFIYNIGIYNNNENVVPGPKCNQLPTADATCKYHDGDQTVVVYARCTDPITLQWRSTQAVLTAPVPTAGCPYRAMAGASCRGNGNQN